MKKKLLLFFMAIVTFFVSTNVFALVITCDYGDYTLEIDTYYYTNSFDLVLNFGNCDGGVLCFYNKTKNDLLFHFKGNGFEGPFESEKDCPLKIYLNVIDNRYLVAFDEAVFHYENDIKTYDLISRSKKNSKKVSCGNIDDIPRKIPELTSMAINIIHIAVPVILVIMGSLDLFKGITAQKEDEIKKGQQVFIKRLILAAIIFFVVVIAKLLISVVANSSSDNISSCIDCFISNNCN